MPPCALATEFTTGTCVQASGSHPFPTRPTLLRCGVEFAGRPAATIHTCLESDVCTLIGGLATKHYATVGVGGGQRLPCE